MVITITHQEIYIGKWEALLAEVKRTTSPFMWGNMDTWFYENYNAAPVIDKKNYMNSDMYRYQFPNQEKYMEFCLKWL